MPAGFLGGGGGRVGLRVLAPGSSVRENLFMNNEQGTSLVQDSDPLYEAPGMRGENVLYESP